MSDEYEVMGVYSYSSEHEYENGERNSRYRHGAYWFVRRIDSELYEVRRINAHHVPSGLPRKISRENFLRNYTPELAYYENNTVPGLETLRKKVRMGRRYFNMGQLDDAEREFANAVIMQEDSVPANIGLSQVYAEQKDFTKLREVLDKLLNIDEVFREEQRHRFNEFGINLRKQGLYDDAIRFYSKALEVNELDENLHFNIARAYHEKEQAKQCREHLERALELAPDMTEAISFLRAIKEEAPTDVLKDKSKAFSKARVRSAAKENKIRKKKDQKKPGKKSHGKVYILDI